jgi:hypothetical protein
MPMLVDPGPGKQKDPKQESEDVLEQGLEDSFPSSDPVAVTQPTVATKKRTPKQRRRDGRRTGRPD